MSLNSHQPLEPSLATNIDQLKKLKKKDDQTHDPEISSILLWIASNHKNIFNKKYRGSDGNYVRNYYVKRLYFSESWESPVQLINTDALNTMMRNYKEIKGICGYMDPCILDRLAIDSEHPNPFTIKLVLGKHINVGLLIEKLNTRRLKQLRKKCLEDDLAVHIRCDGELDLKDLTPLPNNEPKLYISDVCDLDANWVVQAAQALLPKPAPGRLEHRHLKEPYIGALMLPRSKLTKAGVEAIAKGLCELHIKVGEFHVSSPNLQEDEESEDDQSGNEERSIDIEEFRKMISEKYNIKLVCFDDDKGLGFTEIEYISNCSNWSDDKYMYGWGTYGSVL